MEDIKVFKLISGEELIAKVKVTGFWIRLRICCNYSYATNKRWSWTGFNAFYAIL
jgi:hypothetical protein